MRVSVATDDFGAKVFLDGKRLRYCYSADSRKGEAVVYKRIDGEYVVENGEAVRETLTGRIRIKRA
jgi:hypothetical protein